MENFIYKDVVVIGNGPSGITLSYMLAGNWPFYNGMPHPIDFVQQRLEENKDKSIIEQDLAALSEGLEGRSSNPVSVLFDTLSHPLADLGEDNPSVLTWKKNPQRIVDHVVLGKGSAGGSWQYMNGDALTISLGSWMELPSLSIRCWADDANRLKRLLKGSAEDIDSFSDRMPSSISGLKQKRATVQSVARYYHHFVKVQKLERYFIDHSIVTSVTKISAKNIGFADRNATLWEVTGHFLGPDLSESSHFRYITPNVVLATGSSDRPNTLKVPGENLPFVLHNMGELENAIRNNELSSTSGALMVVGAGLSAADAVIAARFHCIPVVHVFRCSVHDPKLVFNRLPENVYPEYHKVHQMMKDPNRYRGYKAFPQHEVMEIKPNKTASLRLVCDQAPVNIVNVSHILVLIGMHPDLSFLSDECQNLGVNPALPVDCKNNSINIDVYTHESVYHPGLYAVGPLVGDNFVRFVQGGCLAVASHLWKKQSID